MSLTRARFILNRTFLWTALAASLTSLITIELYRSVAQFSSQERENARQVNTIRSARTLQNSCANPDNPINYIIGTGQSLSSGLNSNPAVDTVNSAWPNWTFMTNPGIRQVPDYGLPIALDPKRITALVPIAAASTSDGNGETIGATLTWTINDLLRTEQNPRYPVVFTTHGVIGQTYDALKQGTVAYDNALLSVARVSRIVSPRCVVVRAITVIHGEADFLAGTTQSKYEEDLLNWQRTFNTDFKYVTGQNTDVAEFTDQMNSYTAPLLKDRASAISIIPLAQLQATIDHPASIFLVGPKYFLDYTEDGVHLTAASEQLLGEYYGKAYERTLMDRLPWKPLYPTGISISGKVITATFNVPAPPLVLDNTLVADPGNEGFEYSDDSSRQPTITKVVLERPSKAVITLDHAPIAMPGKRFLSYGWTGKVGSRAGHETGPRGNLRDSDGTIGRYSGRTLYNWCVTFHTAF